MRNATKNQRLLLKIEKWICQKWISIVALIKTDSVECGNKGLIWVKWEENDKGDKGWGFSE